MSTILREKDAFLRDKNAFLRCKVEVLKVVFAGLRACCCWEFSYLIYILTTKLSLYPAPPTSLFFSSLNKLAFLKLHIVSY